MISAHVSLSRRKALAFLCVNVQNCRVIQLPQCTEQLDQRLDLVAIHWTKVRYVQTLKHLTCRQNHTNTFLNPLNYFFDPFAYYRHVLQNIAGRLSQVFVRLAQPNLRKVFCQCPLRGVDCH
jgi:hypothetical protein